MDKKFISPEKPPSGIERELLDCMIEELCEIGQRICKAQRFGIKEIEKNQDLTNEDRILYELADLFAVIDMLRERGVLIADAKEFEEMKRRKKEKLKIYLQNI